MLRWEMLNKLSLIFPFCIPNIFKSYWHSKTEKRMSFCFKLTRKSGGKVWLLLTISDAGTSGHFLSKHKFLFLPRAGKWTMVIIEDYFPHSKKPSSCLLLERLLEQKKKKWWKENQASVIFATGKQRWPRKEPRWGFYKYDWCHGERLTGEEWPAAACPTWALLLRSLCAGVQKETLTPPVPLLISLLRTKCGKDA